MKRITALVFAAMLGSAISLGIFVWLGPGLAKSVKIEHLNSSPSVATRMDGTTGTVDGQLDFTYAAERVMPAVVHIRSTKNSAYAGREENPRRQIPDPFRDLFGDSPLSPRFFQNPESPQPSVGSGSGVLINENGYIVTNNHVIDGADDIDVTLHDNRSYKATLLGVDPSTDLALLQIQGEEFPYLPFANSDEVRVGQWVLAVGNPFNLTSTVTAGIVSAKGRNINILRDQAAIESFIQTDAAVNPGNSGGALVNLEGGLIGINTAIASPTGSYSGYSFAVPANLVNKVIHDLIEYGVVQRGYLGVMIRGLDASLSKELGTTLTSGILVDSLLENGAAKAAGIKKGDIITAVDGRSVNTAPELQASIGTHRPGDKVELTLDRSGKTQTIVVELKNSSGNTEVVEKMPVATISVLGAELETIQPEAARKLGIAGGVKVKRLSNGKLKQQTQMREGFIITKVDGKDVSSKEDIDDLLKDKTGGVMVEGVYEDYPGTYFYAFGM
jgi:serine protease Do